MRNTNKKSTFRFPFDINTKVFLVLSAIFFVLSISQVNDYFFPKFSIKKLKNIIEKHIEVSIKDIFKENQAEKIC